MAASIMDEMRAEYRERIKNGAEAPGAEGAFYRLLALLPPEKVVDWMDEEIRRKSNGNDLMEAAAQFLSAYIIQFGNSMVQPHGGVVLSINMLMLAATMHVNDMLSGRHKLECILRDEHGKEQIATIEGLAREHPSQRGGL